MSDELRILLMGYLDGELSAEETRRVEAAIAQDPELRRDYDEMRQLVALTKGLGVDEKTDAALEAFWGTVYNRLERRTGWFLLLGGFFGLVALLSFMFFRSHTTPLSVKVLVACLAAGSLLLLGSVGRERLRAERHDRYSREIHR